MRIRRLPIDRRDGHARIDGDDAGLVGQQRVEIDFTDFRQVGRRAGQV